MGGYLAKLVHVDEHETTKLVNNCRMMGKGLTSTPDNKAFDGTGFNTIAAAVFVIAPETFPSLLCIDDLSAKLYQLRCRLAHPRRHDWLTRTLRQMHVTHTVRSGWNVSGLSQALLNLEAVGAIRYATPTTIEKNPDWSVVVERSLRSLTADSRMALLAMRSG
jgi:hypothetical protein